LELFVAKDEDIPLPAETFSGEVIRAGKHNLPLEVPPRADGQLQTLLCFCLGTTPRDEKIGLFARLVYDDIFGEAHSLQWGWQVDLRDAFVIDDLENVGAFTIEKVFADDVVEQVMKRALISGGTTGKY